jgi:predicted DCC family thiol-disulfide oxidoreductase YuxK
MGVRHGQETATGRGGSRPTLAYDAACGPCALFKRLVEFLDTGHALDFVPLADADERGLLDAVPRDRRYLSAHLTLSDGRVFSGAEAVTGLTGLLPAGAMLSRLLDRSRLARWAVAAVYGVASKVHASGSCGIEGRPAVAPAVQEPGLEP